MFRVLRGEMVKANLTIVDLAAKIGVTEKTLRNKINGDTEFTWSEVCQIHNIVNSEMPKEELFSEDVL